MTRKRRCRAVRTYIKNNIGDRITLGQLATAASMSTYHFARKFKEETGKTPGQFVMRKRVKTAKVQLAGGTAIALVAVACGFSSQSHMTRVFKHQTGTTPGRYQREAMRPRSRATDRRIPSHRPEGPQW